MAWQAANVFMLRQAGFPFELLNSLHYPAAVIKTAAIDTFEADLRATAAIALVPLRNMEDRAAAQQAASSIGMLRPLPTMLVQSLDARLTGHGRRAVHDYIEALLRYRGAVADFERAHQALLDAHRVLVMVAFREDPRLQGVLLLSNDNMYKLFESWLKDHEEIEWNVKTRRRADLLTLYLQRVTAKNETNSYFGPLSAGCFSGDLGLSWSDTAPERRRAYFSHWAAEEIGRVLAGTPSLRPHVRPRRNPLALRDGDEVILYESVNVTGVPPDWTFTQQPSRLLSEHERWLFDRADGVLSLRRLHELWRGDAAALDAAVESLRTARLLFAHFEIPVGEIDPLGALITQLPSGDPGAKTILGTLTEMHTLVKDFAQGEHDSRVRTLAALKSRFEQISGHSANRAQGMHYADRSVLHEECLAQVDNVVAGAWLRDFITGELSMLYDIQLLGPRHRMRRERALMSDWFTARFGRRGDASLLEFYQGYFRDREELTRRCRVVDDEVAAIDAGLAATLMSAGSADAAEIEVDRAAIDGFLRDWPTTPAAVCNPDLMLAASSPEELADGKFLAVVGDCHAMRELLTHSSFGPLIAECHPTLVAEIVGHYQALLDEGEVLCDVVRTHLDKTSTQLTLPLPDVEFLGRSPKGRADTVPAARLRVRHHEHTGLHLYTEGRPGRLRLLGPPANGPSIARDPLAIFSFPRHFGGLLIRGGDAEHLPRFRCGRVVLQRELWRVECGTLNLTREGAAFRAASSLRERLRLPRFVFAKHPSEPKPVLVDFESPLLVSQFVRLARGRIGPVVITEMLPSPDQLWLTANGHHYTSEVRLALFG